MEVESLKQEIRILRALVMAMLGIGTIVLVGAVRGGWPNESFDTLAVHRINVLDREGKVAMVITNHDDFPAPIVNGKAVVRSSGGDENGIVFYNQTGNEQGALIWDGQIAKDGSFSSGTTLSYDSVKTDQLLQVDDANDNGRQSAYVIGWNEPDNSTPQFQQFIAAMDAAPNREARRAIRERYPRFNAPFRFLFGYDQDSVSRVMLADGKGKPRISMFVTASGRAKLQFLDARGKVVYQFPK